MILATRVDAFGRDSGDALNGRPIKRSDDQGNIRNVAQIRLQSNRRSIATRSRRGHDAGRSCESPIARLGKSPIGGKAVGGDLGIVVRPAAAITKMRVRQFVRDHPSHERLRPSPQRSLEHHRPAGFSSAGHFQQNRRSRHGARLVVAKNERRVGHQIVEHRLGQPEEHFRDVRTKGDVQVEAIEPMIDSFAHK